VRIVVQVIKGQPSRAKRGRLAWAVPALLLVGGVAGAAGVAAASVPDAAGTIHACYSTSNGALRVIDTALHQACSTSEKALNRPARSIRWRGSWTSTTAYAVDDSVGYAGGSYMALIANAGKAVRQPNGLGRPRPAGFRRTAWARTCGQHQSPRPRWNQAAPAAPGRGTPAPPQRRNHEPTVHTPAGRGRPAAPVPSEDAVFAFDSGTISVHSHHEDCAPSGLRIDTTFEVIGGTGAFQGASGSGREFSSASTSAPVIYQGSISF